MYPNWTTYSVNATAIFDAPGYSPRILYFDNLTLTNATQNINLYLLEDASTASIVCKVQSLSEPKIADAKIDVYDSIGSYLLTSAYTDASGIAVMPLQENQIYDFIVQKSGYSDLSQSNYIYPGTYTTITNPLNFLLSTSGGNQYEYYDYVGLIDYACVENVTAKMINCTFTDNSGQSTQLCLNVGRYLLSSYDQECYSCSSDLSGQLGCLITSASGNQTFFYQLTVSFPQGTYPLFTDYISFISGTVYGLTGVFAAMMLVVIMACVGLWSPSASVLLGTVGLIVSVWLGIYVMAPAALIGVIVVVGIIVYKERGG